MIEALENECKGQLIGNENVTLISFGDVIDLVFEQPAVDEKEIIRKPFERVLERLEEELELSDIEKERCIRENPMQFDCAKGYSTGISNAIDFVKEEGGIE